MASQTQIKIYLPEHGETTAETELGTEVQALEFLFENTSGYKISERERPTPFIEVQNVDINAHLIYAHKDFAKIIQEVANYFLFRGVEQKTVKGENVEEKIEEKQEGKTEDMKEESANTVTKNTSKKAKK